MGAAAAAGNFGGNAFSVLAAVGSLGRWRSGVSIGVGVGGALLALGVGADTISCAPMKAFIAACSVRPKVESECAMVSWCETFSNTKPDENRQ